MVMNYYYAKIYPFTNFGYSNLAKVNQSMIIPPYLKPGDTIAITCPSGYVPVERIIFAKTTLEHWGYEVITGKTVGTEYFYFSDKDELRLLDLQTFLDNKNVKAILMGRGGYGLSRIIDNIDFTGFIDNPKWICGFSDITVLHNHIHANTGIATLHSPMCGAFKEDNLDTPFLLSLKLALEGSQAINYPTPYNSFNRQGIAEGILTGGNLAMLAHLTGSVSQVNTKGKILFIEDIGEYLYNIDRMLINLKRAGIFDHIAGLICGGFTDLQDTERPFGQSFYEIIYDKVREYDYPVCFDFPSGHQDINFTLRLGQHHQLDTSQESPLTLIAGFE